MSGIKPKQTFVSKKLTAAFLAPEVSTQFCDKKKTRKNKLIRLRITSIDHYIYIYMLHKKTVLVKKRHFYVKKAAFLQIERL